MYLSGKMATLSLSIASIEPYQGEKRVIRALDSPVLRILSRDKPDYRMIYEFPYECSRDMRLFRGDREIHITKFPITLGQSDRVEYEAVWIGGDYNHREMRYVVDVNGRYKCPAIALDAYIKLLEALWEHMNIPLDETRMEWYSEEGYITVFVHRRYNRIKKVEIGPKRHRFICKKVTFERGVCGLLIHTRGNRESIMRIEAQPFKDSLSVIGFRGEFENSEETREQYLTHDGKIGAIFGNGYTVIGFPILQDWNCT